MVLSTGCKRDKGIAHLLVAPSRTTIFDFSGLQMQERIVAVDHDLKDR